MHQETSTGTNVKHVILYQTCYFISNMLFYIKHVILYQTCYFISNMLFYIKHVILYQTCYFISNMLFYIKHVILYQTCYFISNMLFYITQVLLITCYAVSYHTGMVRVLYYSIWCSFFIRRNYWLLNKRKGEG